MGFSFTTVPVPLRETFWGLPAALSLMINVATLVPEIVGVNMTPILQFAPAANELPQL